MERKKFVFQNKTYFAGSQCMIYDADGNEVQNPEEGLLKFAQKVLFRPNEMANYDPNIQFGIHTVEVTLQQWQYTGHLTIPIEGNCHGLNLLQVVDFENFVDEDVHDCKNDCYLCCNEEEEFFSATLKDKEGNTLEVEGDADDFNRMIVKLEITDYRKSSQ